jgi:hypothetical protein
LLTLWTLQPLVTTVAPRTLLPWRPRFARLTFRPYRTTLALQALRAELRQIHDLRFALPAGFADSDEARRFLAQDERIGRRTGKEERGSKN